MIDKYQLRQILAAFSTGLSILTVGCFMGWTSPTLEKLDLNKNQKSLLASIHEIGHLISPIPVGLSIDRHGRLPCLILSGVLTSIGWIIVILTRDLYHLYFARFLFGITMGITFTVVPTYVGEILDTNIRGVCFTLLPLFLNSGHLVEFVLGPLLTYETFAYLNLVVPIVFLLSCFFLFESPYYYIYINNDHKANTIFSKIKASYDYKEIKEKIKIVKYDNFKNLKILMTKCLNRNFMCVVLLNIVQRFSGMSAMVAYSHHILQNNIYSIVFSSLVLLFSFVSTLVINKISHRKLLLYSCFGCFLSHLFSCVITFLHYNEVVHFKYDYNFMLFTSICVYASIYSIGLGPMPNILQGEMLPLDLRGIGSCVCSIVFTMSSFTVTNMFLKINSLFVNFLLYSLNCLFAFVFFYIYLIKTDNKELYEIHNNFDAVENKKDLKQQE
ncbi:sugar transporter ERD6-like 14 isoform X1 [Diaphorina citri]|uniref:Sugar transporter ERD6-like 14 isoform X1 n=1 Tax=Diaphorina citri TaxID=121845 RepID=A0A1S4ECQ9_DIACI|nr:sugar transporter ERD6-like 14 isoform X1 [Diaphorina citri]